MKTKSLLVTGILFINLVLKAQVWLPVGISGPNYRVTALEVYNNELYAGGLFGLSDGSRDLIKWNGALWSTVTRTVSNNVYALAVYNNTLFAGGHNYSFNDPNRMATISGWNGTNWSPLINGVDGNSNQAVEALTTYSNELIVGGVFTSVSGTLANYVAKWNGTNWSTLGVGTGFRIYAMTVFNNELYVGGFFTTAGGSLASNIAKWNGSNWSPLGSGVDGVVYSMKVYNGGLYVGGMFNVAGGNPASKIAKWNGSTWSNVGTGMDNAVLTLEVFNSELYAGGDFVLAGGVSANRVAQWDGSNWSILGAGMNKAVSALKMYNNELYAGGIFTTADNTIANYIARLNSSIGIKELDLKSTIKIYPNPFNNFTTITFESPIANAEIRISTIYGQEIIILKNIAGPEITINKENLSTGLYFISVLKDNKILSTDKIIITD